MALITAADVATDTGLTINSTSKPTDTAVSGFIDEIENEVKAVWLGCGCTWPTDDSPPATYAKLTVLLGAKWRLLDVKYTLASAAMTPDAVAQARLAYNDRVKRISQICVGATQADASISTGPLVGAAVTGSISGSDLGEWTERRDRTLRRPFRPFGWRGFSGW